MLRFFTSAALLSALLAPLAPLAAAETAIPDDAAVATAVKALKVAEQETIIFVEDIHCASCAKKVSSRLFRIKGVMRVRTNVKYDAAVVTPQAKKPLDAAAAWAALQQAGYQPTRLIGPEGTFVPHETTKEPIKIAEAPAPRRN